MALRTRKFDVAKFLETDQDIATYLSEALETGDAAYVAHAFGAVARARGMAKVTRRAGLGRSGSVIRNWRRCCASPRRSGSI